MHNKLLYTPRCKLTATSYLSMGVGGIQEVSTVKKGFNLHLGISNLHND